MTWALDGVTRAVSHSAQTHGGRIIAALASSPDDDKNDMAVMLLSAVCQTRVPDAALYLETKAGTPALPQTEKEASPLSLDPQRPRITRPNGQEYFARKWSTYWDVEVLKKAREAGQFVILFGPPGTGKTAMVEAAFGAELTTVVLTAETRVGELVGTFVPDGAQFRWVDGPLLDAVRKGLPILIDEILLGDPTVLSLLYPLMDGRGFLDVSENPEIGIVPAAKGFYILGAGNPDVPGAKLSEALGSRFDVHVEVTTDWELLKIVGVDPNIVDMMSAVAERATGVTPTISWAPQFRELQAFDKLEKVFGREFALKNLMKLFPRGDVEEVQDILAQVIPRKQLAPARI